MTPASLGRAALVTGGSSGIGLAIAGLLLEDGFDVTIASSNRRRIEESVTGRSPFQMAVSKRASC